MEKRDQREKMELTQKRRNNRTQRVDLHKNMLQKRLLI